jgi:hypothetical protein
MQAVQELYAELFLLMIQSLEEPLEADDFGSADLAVERLMTAIDDTMAVFMREVRSARADGTISPQLDGEILRFQSQLKEGLTAMHQRVRTRMDTMEREREDLKTRLRLVQRKRTGAEGYRKGFCVGAASADDSMEASA